MDNTLKAAIISAAAVLAAAVIGAWKLWAPSARSKTGNISAQTGYVSDSQIAVGNNINQHQCDVHNYYATSDSAAGPFDGKVATRPTMSEIASAIISADPYDRTQIPKKYVGLDVSWPAVFSVLSKPPTAHGTQRLIHRTEATTPPLLKSPLKTTPNCGW